MIIKYMICRKEKRGRISLLKQRKLGNIDNLYYDIRDDALYRI